MSVTRVERDAAMGWWWVEVYDDELWCWVSAGMRLGLKKDTFLRRERAERLADRIDRVVGLLVALAMEARR